MDPTTEDLLRPLVPQVLGALVRRYGNFDTCEDAVQEALLAAHLQWPADGVPDNPRGWLVRVASRRLIDLLRAEQARERREGLAAVRLPADHWLAPAADRPPAGGDDTLVLLSLCCHPALPVASQIALTLRAVGGLTTAEIARAFLTGEDTMTRRISRAKRTIADSGARFALPQPAERSARAAAVQRVLYLVFTEGYAASAGPDLNRVELSAEAIRLTRLLLAGSPDDPEGAGLLALMLLTDARRAARTAADGTLVAMAEQDRSRWDAGEITEGTELITAALARGRPGPYQIQAAIAALHDEAKVAEDTDWPQIAALYGVLAELEPANPVVALNRAVAVAMVEGPQAGLRLLDALDSDERITGDHRYAAARAHLLERSGDSAGARAGFLLAATRTASVQQQRYLRAQAARLSPPTT